MTDDKPWTAFALVILFALSAACGASIDAKSTPTPAPVLSTPTPASATPAPTPTAAPVTGGTWKAEVAWGCDLEHAGGTDTWTADLQYEFTVGADGALTGTGSGTFRREGCTRHNCQCEVRPGPIALDVSGLRQGEVFYIKLDPEYDLTFCTTCPGLDTMCVGGIDQMEWCNCSAAGGPLEVNIEVADHADRTFECNPRTDGAVGLSSVWTEGWTIIKRVQ